MGTPAFCPPACIELRPRTMIISWVPKLAKILARLPETVAVGQQHAAVAIPQAMPSMARVVHLGSGYAASRMLRSQIKEFSCSAKSSLLPERLYRRQPGSLCVPDTAPQPPPASIKHPISEPPTQAPAWENQNSPPTAAYLAPPLTLPPPRSDRCLISVSRIPSRKNCIRMLRGSWPPVPCETQCFGSHFH